MLYKTLKLCALVGAANAYTLPSVPRGHSHAMANRVVMQDNDFRYGSGSVYGGVSVGVGGGGPTLIAEVRKGVAGEAPETSVAAAQAAAQHTASPGLGSELTQGEFRYGSASVAGGVVVDVRGGGATLVAQQGDYSVPAVPAPSSAQAPPQMPLEADSQADFRYGSASVARGVVVDCAGGGATLINQYPGGAA